MKVSSIITNYNQAQFFQSALGSLLNQLRKPDEIIIIDDASTDNSVEIIEKVLSNVNTNIDIKFIVHEQNQKLPGARNTAIKNSTGDIIALLDVDDFYYKDKISKSLEVFNLFPEELGVVYSDYDEIDVRTNEKRRQIKMSYDLRLLKQFCIVSTNSLIRRSVFEECGLYDLNTPVAEDYELWSRVCKKFMFKHIPEALFCYRIHGNNITIKQKDEVIRNSERIRAQLNV